MKSRPSLPSFALLAVKPQKIGVDCVAFDDRSDSTRTPVLITDIEKKERASCFCGNSECYTGRVVSITAFAERVRNLKIQDVMFYFHGFTSQPQDIFSGWKGKSDIQHAYGTDTLVVPVIWPSVNGSNSEEFFINGKSYIGDKWRAKMGGEALINFFVDMDKWCAKEKQVQETLNFRTHLYTHSMGSWVLQNMAEKLRKKHFNNMAFKFGVVAMVQANATPELFKKQSKPFKNSGTKIGQLGKMVVVTYTARDETLKLFSEQKVSMKLFGNQDLGRVGPGDVSHLNNMRVYDASIILPGLESSKYHDFGDDSRFVALMKNEFRMVRESTGLR